MNYLTPRMIVHISKKKSLLIFCKVYKCTLEDLMPAETISYVSSLAGMDTEMLKSMMNVFRKTVGLKTA